MTDLNETYVLLWSHNQDALHIEPLALMLKRNCEACARNDAGDYRVLAVGGIDKMHIAADAVRPTLMGRDPEMMRRAAASETPE